jgi:hypothetical protein
LLTYSRLKVFRHLWNTVYSTVNEAAEIYGLTPSAAALRVINLIADYNKQGHLERELSELALQKYAVNEFWGITNPVA